MKTILWTVDTKSPVIKAPISNTTTNAASFSIILGDASDDLPGTATEELEYKIVRSTVSDDLQYKIVKSDTSESIDIVAEAESIVAVTGTRCIIKDWSLKLSNYKVIKEIKKTTDYYFTVLVKDTAGNISIYNPQKVTTRPHFDDTFGVNGVVYNNQSIIGTYGNTGLVLPDGKIIAAGHKYNGSNTDCVISRYNK